MPRPAARGATLRGSLLALGLSALGCGEVSPGVDPPADRFAFPVGVIVDPRVSSAPTGPCVVADDCASGELCASGLCRRSARWLFVTNANSDLRYNAGSLVPIDLDAFWTALEEGPILDADQRLSRAEPCRRLPNLPQTIECTEEAFALADATVYFGNFPGPLDSWDRDPADDEALLVIPVRGDPSVTWLELSGGLDGANDLSLECDQGSDRRCAGRHRLRYLWNDTSRDRIAREPFRIEVSPTQPYAYVAHQGHPDLTLIDLEGLAVGGDGLPVIADQGEIFSTNSLQGGFGLAERPCDVDSGNVPDSSFGCTRPRVYGSFRWLNPPRIGVSTVVSHEPLPGQTCVELGAGEAGGIVCEPQIIGLGSIAADGLSPVLVSPSFSRPLLADIAFASGGDELYVVQSNPGGLIRLDTSIDPSDGEPRDVSIAAVEVCAQPTSLAIYEDGASRLGLVSCYRTAEVFIVDLASLIVVGLVRAGTGPDPITVDLAREVVYVGNTLDATVSVIDMSPTRDTRYTEIARIGAQEAYSG